MTDRRGVQTGLPVVGQPTVPCPVQHPLERLRGVFLQKSLKGGLELHVEAPPETPPSVVDVLDHESLLPSSSRVSRSQMARASSCFVHIRSGSSAPSRARMAARSVSAPNPVPGLDPKSTRLNSSHSQISHAVF